MIASKIASYILLGAFPIFEIVCYVMLQRKKDDIMIKKRDVTMIHICTVAAWLTYINLINTLFGGIYCGVYHVFAIILPSLSVGPQLLRGVRLWGMLEKNKILFESFGGSTHHLHDNLHEFKEGSSLHVIHEKDSSNEEHSQLSDIHIHVNRRNSDKEKVVNIKTKMIRLIGFTRLLLIVVPTILVLCLFVTTESEKLNETEYEKCFPEPSFVLNAVSSLSLTLSFGAFFVTIFVSHCNDELGIRIEITRNIIILFVTNVLAFVLRLLDIIEWQAVIYVLQQIMLSFSMIILPCMDDSSVVTWVRSTSRRLTSGYARHLPQLPNTRGSIYLPGKRFSAIELKESSKREREATMSLDAGLCILLSSSEGIAAFQEHCSREFSVENVKFWLEVNEFHRAIDVVRDTEERSRHEEKDVLVFAKEIFQTFIEEGSEMQINISEVQSQSIKQRFNTTDVISRDLFDSAQKEVYALMSRHSYPRFLSSKSNANYKAKVKVKRATRRNSAILPR